MPPKPAPTTRASRSVSIVTIRAGFCDRIRLFVEVSSLLLRFNQTAVMILSKAARASSLIDHMLYISLYI